MSGLALFSPDRAESWPELPLAAWKDTYDTLHMWAQIVGKIRLALAPFVNHWWESALYVTPRGLTTSAIPHGERVFQIDFDFVDHMLWVQVSDGTLHGLPLYPRPVADLYRELMSLLGSLRLGVTIDPMPKEVPSPIPFDQDHRHSSYDAEYAQRHWRILLQADRLMKEFRSDFVGKCSPVHFFWGSFDLTVTRFSGRRAPPRPEADRITRVAYSHEVSSCGFWPGGGNIQGPAFYSYAAPEPSGFSAFEGILPEKAFYNPPTRGYILMYDDARRSPDPDRAILDFFRSTYEAAAELGKWNRPELELEAIPGKKRERAA